MPEIVEIFFLETRLGPIFGAISPRGLIALGIPNHDEEYFHKQLKRRAPRAELKEVAAQDTLAGRELLAYLRGELKEFSCPVDLEGLTDFSRAVYESMLSIPFGHTVSYGDIAQQIGKPKGAQAVGQAAGANPVPIVVPCHRVVGSSGALTGFGGGLETKQALLALENLGLPLI